MEHLTIGPSADESSLRRSLTTAFESIHALLEDYQPLGLAPENAAVVTAERTLHRINAAVVEAQHVSSALANLHAASNEALLVAGSSDCALLVVRQTLAELTAELDFHR